MNQYTIAYPKFNIDVIPFKYKYYLNSIFSYYDKSYLLTKVVHEKNRIKDFRLLCDLENKNSELYSELILAINKFNKGKYKHIVSKTISSKILNKANICIEKRIKIILYEDGAVRYLNPKNELIPIICIYFLYVIRYYHR